MGIGPQINGRGRPWWHRNQLLKTGKIAGKKKAEQKTREGKKGGKKEQPYAGDCQKPRITGRPDYNVDVNDGVMS